jgi:hypothetical protein
VSLAGVADDSVNDTPLPVATGGDPSDSGLLFSLQAVRALHADSVAIDLTWPAFAALRGAARATKVARLRMAFSALVCWADSDTTRETRIALRRGTRRPCDGDSDR